jgi:hypothetical protein
MSRQETFATACGISRAPFFRRFGAGAALAWTCGVLVCAQAGCMIPQSVDPIVAEPHVPPQFVPELIPPYLLTRTLTLYVQGAADATASPPCSCHLEFDGLSVEEADSTVDLTVKWFIDYDASNPPSTRSIPSDIELPPIPNDIKATSRLLPTRTLTAADFGNVGGLHVVEVVVGETAGFDPASTTLPSRGMKPGYISASYKFVVDLHLEQIPGTCPSNRPAQRSCP